jgi:demethylmenaquinone methyltransferase/2-methoxy-6-polyprenyl-1,4-benzoquinol methylase
VTHPPTPRDALDPTTDEIRSIRGSPLQPAGNPVASADVGAMFDRIAHVYDPLNAVISGFQEPRWRRRLVAASGARPGMAVLDVATGTGAVARDLARRVGPNGSIVGVDISLGMVERARRRAGTPPNIGYEIGDALALPFDDGAFDAATIAFGMRNLPDYELGFREMSRVVRPGGVVACLEIARPRSLVGRVGRAWFEAVVPRIGWMLGQGAAYAYLVASVRTYPPPEEIAEIMRRAGLVDVAWIPMTAGMVTLHTGRRA